MPSDDNAEVHYPFYVIAENDQVIARLHADLTWSIRWDEVIDQAYASPSLGNAGVVGICQVLLAARDNFRTTPWSDRPQQRSSIDSVVQVVDDYPFSDTRFAIMGLVQGRTELVACVNKQAQWSIEWPGVRETLLSANSLAEDTSLLIPVRGVCELLLAAKDNFITYPFPNEDSDQ